ncbi:DUF2730 family protein [Shewanella algae]|nr:DUF2730 family protein [Shewanella algae]
MLKYWQPIAAVLGIFSALVWVWAVSKFATRKELDDMFKQSLSYGQRLLDVEKQLEYMPSRDELHALDKTLHGLGERLGSMEKGIQALDRKTDLLLENELKGESHKCQ